MEDWGQFLWTVVASSAGTTTLLAAAAWLFKGQISHWLNRDLEAAKAQHQRDLEAYKISLIAVAERAKSGQEIKRASAMKILEMKVDALKRLFDARRGLGSSLLGHAGMDAAWKTKDRLDQSVAKLDVFTDAMAGIELFVDHADYQVLIEYRGQLVKALDQCGVGVEPLENEDQAALSTAVFHGEIAADRMLQAQFKSLESLD